MNNAKKVVLVTGASRGIGKEIALAFGKRDYNVAINYLKSIDEGEKVSEEISNLGKETFLIQADVSKPAQVKNMMDEIIKKWGRLDVLVNNAGICIDRLILKMTDEDWQNVINVNLSGAFWCLREAAQIMSRQKEGSIINVASITGVRGSVGNSNYVASKSGLIGLTKSAAKEFGRFNIHVNCVLPGFHPTDMGKAVWEKKSEEILKEHTLNKLSDTKELAEFIVQISEKKSISGQIYNFDSRVI